MPVTLLQTHDRYPSRIRLYQTDIDKPTNDKIIARMVTEHSKRDTSVRGRLSMMTDEPDDLEMRLRTMYRDTAKAYIDENYDPDIYKNFDFFQDWSVDTYRGGAATPCHTHAEALFAMVYYPRDVTALPTNNFMSAVLEFKTGQLIINGPNALPCWDRFLKEGGAMPVQYTPKAGQILVFPGNVPHYTVPGEPIIRLALACFVTAKTKAAKPLVF